MVDSGCPSITALKPFVRAADIVNRGEPCGTGVNRNNACTREWRIHTSRAFWVHQFPSLFNAQGGTTNNTEFVRQCYRTYLWRDPDASGLQHWVNDLNQYGNPASYEGVNHLIDAFLLSAEFRRRFGPS